MLSTALLAILYFLPSIVSALRKKSNTAAIFILNLLLGWTLIGWVVALVWAFTTDGSSKKPVLASSKEMAESGGKVLIVFAVGVIAMALVYHYLE